MTVPASTPSVRWRAIEPSDLGAVTDLLAAAEAVDHTGENFDVDDVTRFYQSPDIDPRQDSLLAEADGTVVAAGLVIHAVVSQGAYRVSFHARVHPAVRGRGIGEALLRWSLRRGVQMRRDSHPDLPGEVEHLIDEANEPASALCRDAGMTAVRWFVEVERDLGAAAPAVVEPAGTRIVGFHSRYDDVVRQAHNAAFAQHWGYSERDPQSWARLVTGSPHFRPELSVLALAGDEIAGYVLGYVYDADIAVSGIRETWIGQVGTAARYRGRGIASALLARTIDVHRAAGFARTGLDVDVDNVTSALRVYERLGFTVVKRSAAWVLTVPEPGGPASSPDPGSPPASRR